ncbi:MAG: DUF1501 domain-containing protein [Akkermansiaceae bacterium]
MLAREVVTMHDFRTTLLHLPRLDHENLSFYHNGIERRLVDVHGKVLTDILTLKSHAPERAWPRELKWAVTRGSR